MAIKYYGKTTSGTSSDGAAVGGIQSYMRIGPITTGGPVAITGVYCRYSDAGTPTQIRMTLYELAGTEENSTLVSSVVKSFPNPSASPQWVTFDSEWGGTVLEQGKTYLLGTSFRDLGANPDRVLPYYSGGGTVGFKKTDAAGAPVWPAAENPIGNAPFSYPTRDAAMYLGVEESIPQVVIDNVNTNNVITHNSGVVISGSFPAGTYTVNVGGFPLTVVSSVEENTIECQSVNILQSTLAFGATYTLTVTETGSSLSDTIDVTIAASTDIQYKTIAGFFANGILKDIVGVGNGDQVALAKTLAGSNMTLYEDTDVLFSPAVPNGTVGTRYWYDGTSWDSGSFTMNQGATQTVSWTGTPNPADAIVGVPYNYNLKTFLAGDRPITLSLASGVLPNGLSLDSDNEAIVGTPVESGNFQSISILADNGATAVSEYFDILSGSATLSNLTVSNVAQETANISITNNSSAGTLTFAVRNSGPYGPNDANSVKTGPAVWRDTQTPPIVGSNAKTASGLSAATKHYVGVVYSYGTHNGLVATAEFTTTAYPVLPKAPSQCSPYPNLINYRDIPVVHNLLYGWSGDNPKTISINKLPSGLAMDTSGVVTGTPDSVGTTTGIETTVTNAAGSTKSSSFSWLIDRIEEVEPPPTEPTGELDRKGLFDLIKVYSDRFDTEVEEALPLLLKIAEGKLSRMMRVREMSDVHIIPVVDGRDYYTLPSDFAGMRNIQYKMENCSPVTPKYVNPEQGNNPSSGFFYTIITNRLRVTPPLSGSGAIELAYYRRLMPLVNDTDTTWLLKKNPDTYVCALMSEVESFVKNDERAVLWLQRLDKAFDEITYRDQDDRWSGNPLTIKGENI